jgi:GNAT superfamily N-acetyltransferase
MQRWTDEELLHELLVVTRRAYLPWSGTQVIERPGWLQLVTPSFSTGGINEVVYAQLDEHEADAVIDATIAQYRELGLRFRWTVTPDCRPHDLAQRLERRGLQRVEVVGMVRTTEPLGGSDDPELRVELVDAANLSEYIELLVTGWGAIAESAEALGREQLADPVARYAMFLARHRGRPVGAACHIAFERSVYLQGGFVLPEFRQRGVYRAMIAARLQHAAARGRGLATVIALRSSSAPLLEHLGFRRMVEFVSYRGQ